MKTRTKNLIGILAFIALAACFIGLSGCALVEDESIRDVIDKFVGAVNEGDLQGIKECLDPKADRYALVLTADYFNLLMPGTTFTITDYQESGNVATVELTNEISVPYEYTFTMVKVGNTYNITQIEIAGVPEPIFK